VFAVVPGIIGVVDQWSWPYTDAPAAAAWIKQQHLEALPLFVTPDTIVLGVPERLQRPFYQLECQCEDRVVTFARRRDSFHPETDVPPRLIQGFRNLHARTGLLLINRRLTATEEDELNAGGLQAQLVAQFDQGFIDEYTYIYRVKAESAQVDAAAAHPPEHSLPRPSSVN
jgi:hypothetical protein